MTRVILASASKARAKMLNDAGVAVEVSPSSVDEKAIKTKLLEARSSNEQVVSELARSKAISVSSDARGDLVIGADQLLVFENRIYDKPHSMTEAKAHLQSLRGNTHRLISAVSVCVDAQQIWSTSAFADLTMRSFSDEFLTSYMETFGEKALSSVGAYHLEGIGAQLFDQVRGDYFTILGLPLLELLSFLRTKGALRI